MIGTILARRTVKKVFKAFNKKDLVTFMSGWHEDGVFIYPGDIPESGTYNGKENVTKWFRNMMEKFDSINFEVKNICVEKSFDFIGTNTIAVHWDLTLVNLSGRRGLNSGVSIIKINKGKTMMVKDYIFDLGDNFRKNWGIN